MALYKYDKWVKRSDHEAFDALHNPGATTPDSGVYRCENCGHEVVSEKGSPLPPQNHHQHTPGQGRIEWRLLVFARGK
jgi:hypothetical protein